MLATKPLMQMRGFFVSRLCRKLAFVNRRGAKKPNEHEVFIWKALGKVPTEEVGEVKRSRQSRYYGRRFERSEKRQSRFP